MPLLISLHLQLRRLQENKHYMSALSLLLVHMYVCIFSVLSLKCVGVFMHGMNKSMELPLMDSAPERAITMATSATATAGVKYTPSSMHNLHITAVMSSMKLPLT